MKESTSFNEQTVNFVKKHAKKYTKKRVKKYAKRV